MKKAMIASAVAVALLTSCSGGKLGQLESSYFKVTPSPLEAEQGRVTATIDGMFPEEYMHKKATVEVTPELRFVKDGETKMVKGQPAAFQGEKVLGNDQTINYKLGGHYTMKTSFQYEPAMEKSELWLNFDARIGDKLMYVPSVKVADGVLATSELCHQTLTTARPSMSANAFQRVIAQKQEANIRFLIEQTELRKSELKSNSVQEFVALLKRISADRQALNLKNVEVKAYASPDGGVALNEQIATGRQKNSERYVRQQLKQAAVEGPVEAGYTAQDWEGFQQLVRASDIADKEVILRVLAMYQDPEEREQQIRNMSHGFQELADGILPELRRARLTINYETIGRSDQQIADQLKSDASQLSVEELLYAASKAPNVQEQKQVYRTVAQQYPNDVRAYNNLAAIALTSGNQEEARQWLEKARQIDGSNAEVNANLGLLALLQGNIQAAEGFIGRAAHADNLAETLGNLHLAQGNYALAEQDFGNVCSNSAALAQLLNKNYAKAEQTLKSVKTPNGMTDYLRAVVSARQGNKEAAAGLLRSALQKDPSLQKYADNDLELK